MSSKMTQKQHFHDSHKKVADADKLFLFFVSDGLTAEQLQKNIDRRPSIWGKYSSWLKVLPQKEKGGKHG